MRCFANAQSQSVDAVHNELFNAQLSRDKNARRVLNGDAQFREMYQQILIRDTGVEVSQQAIFCLSAASYPIALL